MTGTLAARPRGGHEPPPFAELPRSAGLAGDVLEPLLPRRNEGHHLPELRTDFLDSVGFALLGESRPGGAVRRITGGPPCSRRSAARRCATRRMSSRICLIVARTWPLKTIDPGGMSPSFAVSEIENAASEIENHMPEIPCSLRKSTRARARGGTRSTRTQAGSRSRRGALSGQ